MSRAEKNSINRCTPVARSGSPVRWCCSLRRNVLVQAEEIVGIVVRFYGHEATPPFAVGFWHAVLFVAAHEIHVGAWRHGGTQVSKQLPDPRDVRRIVGGFRPVSKNVRDER